MPTVVKHTIKPAGGGDYTSLNAWNTAQSRNLVAFDEIAVAEVYGSGNATNAPLGLIWTTDKTRYVKIVAASGHGHSGVWDTNKAYMSFSGGSPNSTIGWGLPVLGMSIRIESMQLESYWRTVISVGSGYPHIKKCILTQVTDDSDQPVIVANENSEIFNNIVINHSFHSNGAGVIFDQAGDINSLVKIYNNTIITNKRALDTNQSIVYSENNYLKGAIIYALTGGSGIIKGDNDATSNNEAKTASLREVPYSTDTFVNIGSGTENLYIKNTSSLYNAGQDLSSEGIIEDNVGISRPQNGIFDIGALEYLGPAPGAGPNAHVIFYPMW
jgi:hypothetical protein